MTGRFKYVGCCVDLNVDDVNAMVEHETNREITLDEFKQSIGDDRFDELARSLGYSVGSEPGMRIEDEKIIEYHSSRFRGAECVYVDQSRVWYVFC